MKGITARILMRFEVEKRDAACLLHPVVIESHGPVQFYTGKRRIPRGLAVASRASVGRADKTKKRGENWMEPIG